jgi:hypothetical protein
MFNGDQMSLATVAVLMSIISPGIALVIVFGYKSGNAVLLKSIPPFPGQESLQPSAISAPPAKVLLNSTFLGKRWGIGL